MRSEQEITALLGHIINMPAVRDVVRRALGDNVFFESLYKACKSPDERTGINALWCLTHLQKLDAARLQPYKDELTDMLLAETHKGKKRLLLQLLREMTYTPDTIRTDLLDYCLSKINSECEPYAVRCFSMYCAFKMCRHYPELVAELEAHLEMLSAQSLSPGLQSALRTTRRQIRKILPCHSASV